VSTLIVVEAIIIASLVALLINGARVHQIETDNLADTTVAKAAELKQILQEEKEQAVRDTIARIRLECEQTDAGRNAVIAEQLRGAALMKEDIDEIALFLRQNYQREIGLGYHANRGLGKIVVGYLAREREMQQTASNAVTPSYMPLIPSPNFATEADIIRVLSQQRSQTARETTEKLNAKPEGDSHV
jgi:hypothetical protein